MDDMEDTTMVIRAADVRGQGKEGEFMMDNHNLLEPRERVILREGDSRRSSVQQFVDFLDGKDPSQDVSVVDTSRNPCSSYSEIGEGRVQEFTLGHSSSGFHTINEGEMMEEMLNEWKHEQLLGISLHSENRHQHPNYQLRSLNDLRFGNVSARQLADQNANLNPGQSTYDGSDEVLCDPLSSRGMRTKIISKSFDYPEYFVKNTLNGKGVLCRGPISTKADSRDQNPSTTPNPVDVEKKCSVPSALGTGACELGASQEFVNGGVNLREWMKIGQSKMRKVDRLLFFKEILEVVYTLHSDGKVLVDLRPSCFRLLPSRKICYCGRLSVAKVTSECIMLGEILKSQSLKRPLETGMSPYLELGAKHQKLTDSVNFFKMKPQFELGCGLSSITNAIDANLTGPGDFKIQGKSSRLHLPPSSQQHAIAVTDQLEEKWYRSPEEFFGRSCTSSSNIYCLGVFFFELLGSFDSGKKHAAAMSDLRHRILPPNFLSENPKEAGFCLWLLHPEPSLRPSASDILQSEVIGGLQETCGDDNSSSFEQDEEQSEILLDFLMSMKERKQKGASKLVEDLGCIEADIQELEKRHSMVKPMSSQDGFLYARGKGFMGSEDRSYSRFSKSVAQLESAYISARCQMQDSVNVSVIREDCDILKDRENWFANRRDEEHNKPIDDRGAFFDGLCKYARYSRLEVCGTLRNREITNSTNVICSMSFDRDEDYFAAAGVSKKIKIFEFQALCDDSVDIHYPMIEMSNKSKLSCVSWNNYIRNYLASTDYDGIVKLWDASTGQAFSQYVEHEKRAWSVDFSPLDPTRLVSGSDDCSVKLWSINEKNCLHSIRNIANVCCVQFSAHSSHLLAYGSADYKIYCYDLRNANVPWCVLAGHNKAVSYVKFVDSATLVSASTDNTLKLWDLNRSSSVGLSNDACSLTLGGHTNEKNFVGLSVTDGYIACGSETNEVYTYYKSLPMPITSHKFGSIDPISAKETDDDNGQFVSSVSWKGKSNVLVAANSSGCIKVLKMV